MNQQRQAVQEACPLKMTFHCLQTLPSQGLPHEEESKLLSNPCILMAPVGVKESKEERDSFAKKEARVGRMQTILVRMPGIHWGAM